MECSLVPECKLKDEQDCKTEDVIVTVQVPGTLRFGTLVERKHRYRGRWLKLKGSLEIDVITRRRKSQWSIFDFLWSIFIETSVAAQHCTCSGSKGTL